LEEKKKTSKHATKERLKEEDREREKGMYNPPPWCHQHHSRQENGSLDVLHSGVHGRFLMEENPPTSGPHKKIIMERRNGGGFQREEVTNFQADFRRKEDITEKRTQISPIGTRNAISRRRAPKKIPPVPQFAVWYA
jgi:hypothetical protein